jgi:pyruvate ferredoxin oxidoreductase gamma subunit
MSKMMEVRWHGRGGQGAKTAAMLLAEAALDAGKYIQAFPEYGPERAGAPIRAFTRISNDKIDIHCAVTNPHIVVVIDPTLVGPVNVTDGLDDDGLLLVNTNKTPGEVRELVNMKGGRVYTVDASKIALETLGRDLPNTPMLGALVAATSLIDQGVMEEKIREKFLDKMGEKGVKANLDAIHKAAAEVKSE